MGRGVVAKGMRKQRRPKKRERARLERGLEAGQNKSMMSWLTIQLRGKRAELAHVRLFLVAYRFVQLVCCCTL